MHHFLYATAWQRQLDVVLVSEPNATVSRDWYRDRRGDAAVKALLSEHVVTGTGRSEGLVWVRIGQRTITATISHSTEELKNMRTPC